MVTAELEAHRDDERSASRDDRGARSGRAGPRREQRGEGPPQGEPLYKPSR